MDLYVEKADGSLVQISAANQNFPGLTTSASTGDQQAQLSDKNGVQRPLVHSISKTPVYTINNW